MRQRPMLPEVHDAHALHRLAPSSTVCRCGKECLGCRAAALSVTCGCEFEAKQFEYRLDDVAAGHDHHAAHGVAPSATAAADERAGHADHGAMMADPRMAAAMEADMRRRFSSPRTRCC